MIKLASWIQHICWNADLSLLFYSNSFCLIVIPTYLLTYTTFINKFLTYMITNHGLKRWNMVHFHWSLPTSHQRPQTMKPLWNNIYIFSLHVTSIFRSLNNWLIWQWRSPRYPWFFDCYWFEPRLDKLIRNLSRLPKHQSVHTFHTTWILGHQKVFHFTPSSSPIFILKSILITSLLLLFFFDNLFFFFKKLFFDNLTVETFLFFTMLFALAHFYVYALCIYQTLYSFSISF